MLFQLSATPNPSIRLESSSKISPRAKMRDSRVKRHARARRSVLWEPVAKLARGPGVSPANASPRVAAPSELGNVKRLADHQRAGEAEEQHERMQQPRPDLPRAAPQQLVDKAFVRAIRERPGEDDARRNGRALEVLHLARAFRERLGGHVVAR